MRLHRRSTANLMFTEFTTSVKTHANCSSAFVHPQDPYASVCTVPEYNVQGSFGGSEAACRQKEFGGETVLHQCMVEQKYIRGAMMRSLLYAQVSISGQALVLVVRNQKYSLAQVAGLATYLAFILAQIGSTLIAVFGFGGYVPPRDRVEDCQFCTYSDYTPVKFFPSKEVPIEGTESRYTASVIGCV